MADPCRFTWVGDSFVPLPAFRARADLYAAFRAGASGLAAINRFTTRSPAAERPSSGGRGR